MNASTHTRTVKGRQRRDRYIPVECPNCGEIWEVRADRVKHVRSCYTCSQRQKGRKGWRATCEKYGTSWAAYHWRTWRLDHPTCLERAVAALLDGLGVSYEREYVVFTATGCYLVDFLIEARIAIEVNGAYWHDQRPEQDAQKRDFLRWSGFDVLTISESSIRDGSAHEQLMKFISERL